MTWKVALIFVLTFLVLGFIIGQSCNTNESLNSIDKAISESEKRFDEIQEQVKALSDSLSVLAIERIENKNYYTYETYKIDSLIRLDSSMVNSIIRARLERLYRLPDFFLNTPDSDRVINVGESTSSW